MHETSSTLLSFLHISELPSLSENKMHLNQSCRHATMDPTSLEPPWTRCSASKGTVFGILRSASKGAAFAFALGVRRSDGS